MWTVSLLGVCVLCGTTYAFTLLTVWHLMLFMWDHNLNSWHTLYDERSGLASSLIINILLLGFMFIQHTGMASIRLKSFLQDTIGLNSVIIRPLYIAATSCVLQVTINNWRRIPTFTLWSMVELSNDSWWFFFWVHLLSWTLLYGHCLMLDFGEMMGVKQVQFPLPDNTSATSCAAAISMNNWRCEEREKVFLPRSSRTERESLNKIVYSVTSGRGII